MSADRKSAAKKSSKPKLKIATDGPPPPDKPLPHDLVAERHLAGVLMLEGAKVVEQIPPARDFYHPGIALVVSTAKTLIERGEAVTIDAIQEEADQQRAGLLDKVLSTDPLFLINLQSEGVMASLGRDAASVRNMSQLRRQLAMFESAAADIRERGAEEASNVLELNRAMLRDADSLTTDARRAITRGSDVEIGRAVLELVRGGGERLILDQGAFYQYDAAVGIWRAVPEMAMQRAAQSLDGLDYGDDDQLFLTSAKIKGAITCAAAQAERRGWLFPDPDDDEGRPPPGLAFTNAFVRVGPEGITSAAHSPANRCTSLLRCVYSTTATTERWQKFLDDIFDGDEDWVLKEKVLQEFIGISLLGLAPLYGRALFAVGVGANGKDTLLEIIESLFPAGSVGSLTPQMLDGRENPMYMRAQLAGLLLNSVSELPVADLMESVTFKASVTGNPIMARHPAGRPFRLRARAGWLMAANKLPPVADHTHGFWRRVLIITFNRLFSEAQQIKGLAKQIIAAEKPGIVRWALEGAVQLMQRGYYRVPASSEAAMDKWRRSADPVRLFVDDRCTVTTDPVIGGQALYIEFRKWCEANGHRPLSNNNFAERLEGAGYVRARRADGNFWHLDLAS